MVNGEETTRSCGSGAAICSPVAVLFVRADSIYKSLPGLDAWDAERDATKYQGPHSIVAHPPCRSWGCLRANANPKSPSLDKASLYTSSALKWRALLF